MAFKETAQKPSSHKHDLTTDVVNLPTCQAKRTTTQNISSNTFTYLDFNGTNWQKSITYETTGITVPKDGIYLIHAQVPWPFVSGQSGTKVMEVHLFTGSTDNGIVVQDELYNPGGLFLNNWHGMAKVNKGQKVRLGVFQNSSTGTIAVSAGAQLTVSWYCEQ
ncbi:hypothetical protein [Rhodococcus opacus]|uniref:hypothetical protein n=1 Tax=Rhodococcus opacus TaxID=37919 RepID=UPI001009D0DC|nr:hypothetical protein [Rhodococcus opacus]